MVNHLSRSKEKETPTIIMFDLMILRINDRYGHIYGDYIIVKSATDSGSIGFRYSGKVGRR